jgi:hypothetical protein
MVIIPAADLIRKAEVPYKIGFAYHPSFEEEICHLLAEMERKRISQLAVQLDLPFRPRSTGFHSQNNHIYGHCADISRQIKNENSGPAYTTDEVKEAMKRMAVRDGYPTKYSPIDDTVIPKPTRFASVEEAQILLDVIHYYADAHDLWLHEYAEDGSVYRSVGGRTPEEMEKYWDE